MCMADCLWCFTALAAFISTLFLPHARLKCKNICLNYTLDVHKIFLIFGMLLVQHACIRSSAIAIHCNVINFNLLFFLLLNRILYCSHNFLHTIINIDIRWHHEKSIEHEARVQHITFSTIQWWRFVTFIYYTNYNVSYLYVEKKNMKT